MKRSIAELITRDPEKFAHHDRVFKNNPVVMQGMGLAPLVIDELFEKIKEINDTGLPVLMVEQNARKALKVSDYAYVISQGKISMEGRSSELIHDSRVIATYFGKHWKSEKKL